MAGKQIKIQINRADFITIRLPGGLLRMVLHYMAFFFLPGRTLNVQIDSDIDGAFHVSTRLDKTPGMNRGPRPMPRD